ncbi:MAG: chemotaxis response regulator protein-glutamate methylesterase [Clostridiales bacterium]|nr:chemotaxis response regulator protein-glutamate methylesterase [Clostridiales bacterium]
MKVKSKIRVLIVDDSLLFRETLATELNKDFGIEVVGTAVDPYDARDKILSLKPDVMTLDVEMPKMDGIEFLRKLMPQYPLPVVVVSSDGNKVLDALDAGAVDFVAKPSSYKTGKDAFLNELIVKIKIASSAKVASHKKDYEPRVLSSVEGDISDMVIAIGASTGGTEAIHSIIKAFPRDMPGILIVQHMPPVFTKLYAERLNNSCALEVKEAEDKDLVKPGRVLIAPGDYHMILKRGPSGLYVKCEKGEKVSGHCPSVDVLFDSVAKVMKNKSIGIILTGMGRDGASGLLNMKKQGAYTIGQDEETSVVYGMPMVAYNIGAVMKQLPLEEIPREICKRLSLK